MTNPNYARNLLIASGAAVTCLGFTACTVGASSATTEAPATAPAPASTANTNSQPSIERTFNSNGTEVTIIHDPSDGNAKNTHVISYCEGADLIDATTIRWVGTTGAAGASISRSPDHPACADGRLDPADFEIK